MKNGKLAYKNSAKNDFVANLLIIVISILLIFLSAKFFADKKSASIVIYAIAIAFSYCRIAVEAIEKALVKKIDGDIVSTAAVLIIFAAQKFYAAAMVAVFYSICKYIFELINADFSDKLLNNNECLLKYNILDDSSSYMVYSNELEIGQMVIVNNGDYLCFNGKTSDLKSIKSGYFTGEDNTIVTIEKLINYEIDFKNSIEEKEKRSKTENIINLITISYSVVLIILGIAYLVYGIIKNNGIFEALYGMGVIWLLANPLSLNSGCNVSNLFYLFKLKNNGINLESSAQIERMSNIKKIYFNKSEVITNGDYQIKQIFASDGYTEQQVADAAACTETGIDNKIASLLKEYKTSDPEITEQTFYKSKGVTAQVGGKYVVCGSKRLMDENNIDVSLLPEASIYIAADNALIGAITLTDVLSHECVKAIKIAGVSNIKTSLISGDCESNVEKVAGICEFNEHFSLFDNQNKIDIVDKSNDLKHTAFIGNTSNIKAEFVASTDNTYENKIERKSLLQFIKTIASAKYLKVFMYIRIVIGVLSNIAIGLFMFSSKSYEFFHNLVIQTANEDGATGVMNTIVKFLMYETHAAPWLIVILQLILINVFFMISISFLNDDKKLRQ